MILGFFFSRDTSLKNWRDLGLLDREKMIFEKHLEVKNLEKIYWFTYGSDDLEYREGLHESILIIPMPKLFNFKFGTSIYSFLLPFIQKKYIKKCDILKNDQMDGSWSAVISKLLYKKKLLIRTGFTLSLFMRQKDANIKEFVGYCMEKFAYKFCDYATVSSNVSKTYVMDKYKTNSNIKIMFNYIDVERFLPTNNINKLDRLVFIGRFDEQKNIHNLLIAIKGINMGLDLYGDGVLKNDLKKFAENLKIDIRFLGKVPNDKMPEILNLYNYYILPSLYEGMPKTLLEAMSCGLVCIGTDTLGINEVINNDKNGYLINGFESEHIKNGIKKALNSNKNQNIRNNARNTVLDIFSLNTYVLNENKIFMEMINQNDK